MFNCFKKLMCVLGHHDFIAIARWCSPKRSITIEEYHCTQCGEIAYKLITFNPSTCESLSRHILTGVGTCEDYGLVAGVGRDRRVSVETEKTEAKQCKPRSTGAKPRKTSKAAS